MCIRCNFQDFLLVAYHFGFKCKPKFAWGCWFLLLNMHIPSSLHGQKKTGHRSSYMRMSDSETAQRKTKGLFNHIVHCLYCKSLFTQNFVIIIIITEDLLPLHEIKIKAHVLVRPSGFSTIQYHPSIIKTDMARV